MAQLADKVFGFAGTAGSKLSSTYKALNKDHLSADFKCHEINNPVAVGRTYSVKCIRNQKSASGVGVELVLGAVRCKDDTAVDQYGKTIVKSVGSRLLVSTTPEKCQWPFTPTVVKEERCVVVPAFMAEKFHLAGSGAYVACGYQSGGRILTDGVFTVTAEHIKGDWPIGVPPNVTTAGDVVFTAPNWDLADALGIHSKIGLDSQANSMESILEHIVAKDDLGDCTLYGYAGGLMKTYRGSVTVSAGTRVDGKYYPVTYAGHFTGVGSGDSGSPVLCGGWIVGIVSSSTVTGVQTISSLSPVLVSANIRTKILSRL